MPTSILITGADSIDRINKALEIALVKSSKFDTHIIDTDEEKGIAAAKSVVTKVSQKPFESELSTIIIKEAQNLTVEAQNSLLKTLEEPAEKTQLVLTAPNSSSVLATIYSRCLEISLGKTTKEEAGGQNFTTEKLSSRLETIEKSSLDELLQFWEKKLKEAAISKSQAAEIAKLHRYNKTLLKLKKAEKFAVNKKLLSLIAALETPIEA